MSNTAKKLDADNPLQAQDTDKTFDELEDSFDREFSRQSSSPQDDLQSELDDFDGLEEVSSQVKQVNQESNVTSSELDNAIPLSPGPASKPNSNSPNQTKTKTRATWPMRLTVLALLVGVVGLGYVGYVNQEQIKAQVFTLSDTLTTLAMESNTNAQETAELQTVLNQLNQSTQELVTQNTVIQNELTDLRNVVAGISNRVVQNTQTIQTAQQDLLSLQTQLNQFTSQFDELTTSVNSKFTEIEKKVSSPSNASAVFNVANNIEGATLESVDRWNNIRFVNLRDTNGNWISLRQNSSYKGWVVKSIEDSKVVFNRGGKSGQNKVLSPIK